MSAFSADRATEAICLFEPRNGNVFPYGPVAELLSSLPDLRRVRCRFDALMRATGVHPTWSGERAGKRRRLGPGSGHCCGRRSYRRHPQAWSPVRLSIPRSAYQKWTIPVPVMLAVTVGVLRTLCWHRFFVSLVIGSLLIWPTCWLPQIEASPGFV